MDVTKKDATITNTDEEFPGSFEVVLSAPTLDRDGDTLLPDEWKLPLPEKITFDSDHGMSVASTVGSGTPSINAAGELVVSGTYSSLPRAQEVRTLVNEGHINTTSVAFISDRSGKKDGKTIVKRELLNGAFVAIPSNREALILSSKGVKTGARNSAMDAKQIQSIHDSSAALGANCGSKSLTSDVVTKDADPVDLIQATDASLDQATDLFDSVDITTLPAEIQQAIALVQAAGVAIDEFMDVAGIPDPDEDAADSGATDTPASGAAKSAPVAGVKVAPVEAVESDAVTAKELEAQVLRIRAAQFI